jgi:hypothetical protein
VLHRCAPAQRSRRFRPGRSLRQAEQDAGRVFNAGGPCAEEVARKILDAYLEPDKNFVELREMAIDGTMDLLQGFSAVCRGEFEEMQATQF